MMSEFAQSQETLRSGGLCAAGINMESLLDPCNNCSLYMGYLKIMAKNQGKILDLKVISSAEYKSTTIVKEKLK